MLKRLTAGIALLTFCFALLAPALADTGTDSSPPINLPPVDATKDQSAQAAAFGFTVTEPQQKILDLLDKGQYGDAKKLIQSSIAESKAKPDPGLFYLLSYVDSQAEDYKSAIQALEKTLSLETPGTSVSERSLIFQIKCLGDCYYNMQRTKDALTQYQRALELGKKLSEEDPLRVDLLEPVIGCLLKKKDYAAAEPYAEQLLSVSQELANDGRLYNLATFYWSALELLTIYNAGGETEKHEQLQKKFISLLDRVLALRNTLQSKMDPQERLEYFSRVQRGFLNAYVTQNHPATLPEYLWLASGFKMRTLPLISWEPIDQKPKAAILCVHGLGLENRAFESFAGEMVKRDFLVYAIDVRGFGAWQTQYGFEDVSFDRAIADIRPVMKLIANRNPGLPIFLLGESMGGGMVLRAGSDYDGEMAGIISSAPSAERYGEKRMSIRVAMHLLHPDRPFDIGTEVAKQATSKLGLRKMWETDPKAKIKLSPIELMKFDRFMIDTQKKCELIKVTPVLVVQGLSDRLVKPKGTYDMFDNITSPDKTMIIVGNAEHLIFETPQQPKVLLDGMTSWLENHIKTQLPESK